MGCEAEAPSTVRHTELEALGNTSDRVWTILTTSLLAAVDAGRAPGELRGFLDERAVHPVPATVHRLLADVEARSGQVRDLGTRRVLERVDPSVATLLAQDRSLRGAVQPAR